MEKAKKFVYVSKKLCKGCGICIEFCPKKVFDWDAKGKSAAVRIEDCIGCGLCITYCPDFAIILDPDELPLIKKISGEE
ncbi:MAG TPA: 4Fe-4S dicluster domain-containing protein [Firmicutes bacterium]|nr:4Fe-4S dicluster domain-containing protein [Bacillota bacterium]